MAEITVVTCDKNAYLIRQFYTCFKAAWPDCPYPVTVAGNTQLPELPEANPNWRQALMGPDRGWASTVLTYVGDNAHRAPYLLLLEDYLLSGVRYPERIEAAFRTCTLDEVGMVRLNPCPGPTIELPELCPESELEPPDGWGAIDLECPYSVSLQPAIWDHDTILRLFAPGESAWHTETSGSRRAWKMADSLPPFLCSKTTLLPYNNLLRHGRKVEAVEQWYRNTFG